MLSLPSTNDSPQTPSIRLTSQNKKHINKFINSENTDISVAAFGPKCFVSISIVKKATHDTIIPQSSASQFTGKFMLLLASKFIANIDKINSANKTDGTDFNKITNSLNSLLILCIKQNLLVFYLKDGFARNIFYSALKIILKKNVKVKSINSKTLKYLYKTVIFDTIEIIGYTF